MKDFIKKMKNKNDFQDNRELYDRISKISDRSNRRNEPPKSELNYKPQNNKTSENFNNSLKRHKSVGKMRNLEKNKSEKYQNR